MFLPVCSRNFRADILPLLQTGFATENIQMFIPKNSVNRANPFQLLNVDFDFANIHFFFFASSAAWRFLI
jgi:hypothetical protein